jgi:hypothetical protein
MSANLSSAILRQADRVHILGALGKIKGKAPSLWLPANHAAIDGGHSLTWGQASSIAPAQLIDAVAICAPTHCVDGWGFVSRAFAAALAGDQHCARHMAYYAQLRAALSILANLGVGIFNGVNFVVDGSARIQRLDPPDYVPGLGTHQIAWLALDEWGKDPRTAANFLSLMRIRNTPVGDIIKTIWPGFTGVTTTGSLVRAWGIDLRRGLDDRKYRNLSSYAPQALNPIPEHLRNTLRFIENAWRAFEPGAALGGFDELDRHLLCSLLQKQHNIIDGNLALGKGAIKREYLNLPPSIQNLVPLRFLLETTQRNRLELLRFAEVRGAPASSLQMIARALMLLRVATSFTQSSLKEAGVDCEAGDVRPWLRQVAVERGFWATGAIGSSADLWADVDVALSTFSSGRQPVPQDLYTWMATSNGMPTITQVERVAMWSFCD